MEPWVVADIINEASNVWTFSNDVEITLEANPTSSEADRFEGYRTVGVNRLSLGVQALNDHDLKALGRLHSVAEARKAVDLAMSNFDRVSFDLIYARQNQSLDQWQSELSEAIGWGSSHLSLYQLTIEDGTAFGDRFSRGKLHGLPTEDLAADMYFATQELCDAAGLKAYETSNHARSGEESVHNQIYWCSGDYIGVGPGAHGRISLGNQRYATETHLTPLNWLGAVESSATGETERVSLTKDERLAEFLMMGLRTTKGVDLARIEIPEVLLFNINMLIDDQLLELEGEQLRATAQGRPLLNAILRQLLGS